MRAARTDATQVAIVAGFRKLGCLVQPLHTVGKGVPDLLCSALDDRGEHRTLFLVECKVRKGKLTPDQVEWHALWAGAPIFVVTDVSEIPRVIDEAMAR